MRHLHVGEDNKQQFFKPYNSPQLETPRFTKLLGELQFSCLGYNRFPFQRI